MQRLNCELAHNCAEFPVGFISALTLNGSTLTAERVDVTAGALNITSLQDTSTFSSRQTMVGGLQSLAVNQIKHLADSLMTETPNADGTVTRTQNAKSEALRAALQAIVACGGASAAGSNCGGAAMGAGVSAVAGSLLNLAMKKDSVTYVRGANGALVPDANSQRSLEEQQAVTQLIGTLAGAVAIFAGTDVELDRFISLRLKL